MGENVPIARRVSAKSETRFFEIWAAPVNGETDAKGVAAGVLPAAPEMIVKG